MIENKGSVASVGQFSHTVGKSAQFFVPNKCGVEGTPLCFQLSFPDYMDHFNPKR